MAISLEQIEIALYQHLAGMLGVPPIAWPKKDANPVRPFLAVDHIPGSRDDPTLDGTGETVIGQLHVSVVVGENQFVTSANALADRVMARFAYKTRISFASGVALVTKPPEVLAGYKDGPDFRVPVRVDYAVQT